MQYFYDGQIRRYLVQTIRVLSNFVVKYSDGTLHQIPVLYGDPDRQAATVLKQNSSNGVASAPRIAVYITGLDLDRDRLSDSTYVGKLHFRERDIVDTSYTQGQGRNYTVERLMPTPFKLTMKVDIWSTSAEQKLQILEQILVLFNPSLELQTTDNYIDWTSLSVLNLGGINWTSRSVPMGTENPIDIATLTLETPIWISPPAKIKHLGVITNIITSIYKDASISNNNYIEGLAPAVTDIDTNLSNLLMRQSISAADFIIAVYKNTVLLLDKNRVPYTGDENLVPNYAGSTSSWVSLFDKYPGKYIAGSTTIFLRQQSGLEVIGTVTINSLDETQLIVDWDSATYPSNTAIDTTGDREASGGRSTGTFDAIIDPTKNYPGTGITDLVAGDRFLIVDDIIDTSINDIANPWGNFTAVANDIIEWDGSVWNVIFDSAQNTDVIVYQTNIYTGIQYMWNGVSWIKSFEGEYREGQWRIEL